MSMLLACTKNFVVGGYNLSSECVKHLIIHNKAPFLFVNVS